MLQRLLDTASLTGGQWVVVIALSLVAPALVGIDKAIQQRRPTARGRRLNAVREARWDEARREGHQQDNGEATGTDGERPREAAMKSKEYMRELRELHGELVAMQEWVKATGAKVCIVFEGRDTAGKGGTIKAITERVSPRVFRVVALPAPTEREKSQMYIQRYMPHLPAAGEVVIFDRSWYNRAGVERVMGFCTEEQSRASSSRSRRSRRRWSTRASSCSSTGSRSAPRSRPAASKSRIDDPRKTWKLSDLDLRRTGAGTTTPVPATTCSRRPTPHGRRGSSRNSDDKRGPAERDLAPPRPDPVRVSAPQEGEAARPQGARRHA